MRTMPRRYGWTELVSLGRALVAPLLVGYAPAKPKPRPTPRTCVAVLPAQPPAPEPAAFREKVEAERTALLVLFTRRRDLMGDLVNRRPTTAVAVLIATVIVALNLFLLFQTFFG